MLTKLLCQAVVLLSVSANAVQTSSCSLGGAGNARAVYAQCKLQHDSMNNAPKKSTEATQGFLRIKQTYGRPLLVTGYGKYLPEALGTASGFRIAVNDLPVDEFHDCASSGATD